MFAQWLILAALVSFTASPSYAATSSPAISQQRFPEESFEAARDRHFDLLGNRFLLSQDSAEKVSLPWDRIDDSVIPEWSENQLQSGFEKLRDTRFLDPPEMPNFWRRSSWLYPDDGCFARAALGGKNLQHWGYPRPMKLFVFGKLYFTTENSPEGGVTWWYHIVPVVRVNGEVRILDPSVETHRPMRLQEWVERMGSTVDDSRFSVCDPGTYAPYSSCANPGPSGENDALDDQYSFLDMEWKRLQDLGRDPKTELGDRPPWR